MYYSLIWVLNCTILVIWFLIDYQLFLISFGMSIVLGTAFFSTWRLLIQKIIPPIISIPDFTPISLQKRKQPLTAFGPAVLLAKGLLMVKLDLLKNHFYKRVLRGQILHTIIALIVRVFGLLQSLGCDSLGNWDFLIDLDLLGHQVTLENELIKTEVNQSVSLHPTLLDSVSIPSIFILFYLIMSTKYLTHLEYMLEVLPYTKSASSSIFPKQREGIGIISRHGYVSRVRAKDI